MPRYYIYVNTNQDRKHITIHGERSAACGHIFQNVTKGSQYEGEFFIEKLDKTTFKTAETKNGYWLIIWSESLDQVNQNLHLLQAEQGLKVSSQFCNC